MLQEFYRINNYKPIYALKSSTSLLLQIPFFIAAYNLLSGMKILLDIEFFMPLFMVKDFDASGFTVCEDVMTNAGTQFVFYSKFWHPEDNHGNTFIPGTWYTFHGTNPRNQYSWPYSGGG